MKNPEIKADAWYESIHGNRCYVEEIDGEGSEAMVHYRYLGGELIIKPLDAFAWMMVREIPAPEEPGDHL